MADRLRPVRYSPNAIHAGMADRREVMALLERRLALAEKDVGILQGLAAMADASPETSEKLAEIAAILATIEPNPTPTNVRKRKPAPEPGPALVALPAHYRPASAYPKDAS